MSLVHEESKAAIWLGPTSDNLHIIIQGKNPSTLLQKIKEVINQTVYNFPAINLSYHFLCPKCITDAIESYYNETKSTMFKELPESMIRNVYTLEELRNAPFKCKGKGAHSLNVEEMLGDMKGLTALPSTSKIEDSQTETSRQSSINNVDVLLEEATISDSNSNNGRFRDKDIITEDNFFISANKLSPQDTWEKIGEGGSSEVYLATYCNSPAAIKRYNSQEINVETPEFEKEFRALK